MNSKPHRTNSDFQLKYFLAGSCHTIDGAWTLMYGQKIDIEGKVRYAKIAELRRNAKHAAAMEILKAPNTTEAARLNAEADIQEVENERITSEMNVKAAIDELACINKLMSELEPHRKFGHLSLLEANEACQREEWLEELKTRAENFLVCQGAIPHDQLSTMRSHPDFETILVPHIKETVLRIQTNKDGVGMLKQNKMLLLGEQK
jgi:hypothetical protein